MMNRVQVTDELLYQCMPTLVNKRMEALPTEEALPYDVPDHFQKRMELSHYHLFVLLS